MSFGQLCSITTILTRGIVMGIIFAYQSLTVPCHVSVYNDICTVVANWSCTHARAIWWLYASHVGKIIQS